VTERISLDIAIWNCANYTTYFCVKYRSRCQHGFHSVSKIKPPDDWEIFPDCLNNRYVSIELVATKIVVEILIKGCIACWGLNVPFYCMCHSRHSLSFSVGQTTCKNCPFPLGNLDPSTTLFPGSMCVSPQTASPLVQPFLQGTRT